jgi:hypothetical protein
MDDRGRDGGTNFIFRIKEQETRLTLHEHDDNLLCRSVKDIVILKSPKYPSLTFELIIKFPHLSGISFTDHRPQTMR